MQLWNCQEVEKFELILEVAPLIKLEIEIAKIRFDFQYHEDCVQFNIYLVTVIKK